MDCTQINTQLAELNVKVDELTENRTVIHAHPVMFVILLVGFFITMDFWATAAHSTVHHFHPKGYLEYWEYIILALIALALLLWIGKKSGIRIQMLGET